MLGLTENTFETYTDSEFGMIIFHDFFLFEREGLGWEKIIWSTHMVSVINFKDTFV